MEKYKVFAGRLQALPPTIEFSYYGGNSKYMLVYSPFSPDISFTEIPLEKEKNLASDEREWLARCKITLSARWSRENEEERVSVLEEIMNRWEEELKKARKELNENESREERIE